MACPRGRLRGAPRGDERLTKDKDERMTLEWKDEYGTGVERVDVQHRTLFGLLNDLEQMIERGVEQGPEVDDLLQVLGSDTQAHFAFEERCMTQHKCPAAGRNKRAHEQFLSFFRRFRREYEEKGSSAALLRGLHDTAEQWVVRHICEVDVELASCAHQKTAG